PPCGLRPAGGLPARDRRPARASPHPLLVMLRLVGLSHRVAPVELRERVALPGARAGELAHELAGETGEAVCLSTCNRAELYVAGDEAGRRTVSLLAEVAGLGEEEFRPVLYRLENAAAALPLSGGAARPAAPVP